MVSEFRIKQELALIELVPAQPVTKAKRMLRLAKSVRKAALRMADLSYGLMSKGDGARGARFRTAMSRLIHLEIEIRNRARAALRASKAPLGYGYEPRKEAYPKWDTASPAPEMAQ